MGNFDEQLLIAKPNRKTKFEKKKSRKERLHYKKWLKQKIDAFKLKYGCGYCGYKRFAQVLEFHHIEPNEKKYSIGTMLFRGFSWEAILEEIDKCLILCKNCHTEKHIMEDIK